MRAPRWLDRATVEAIHTATVRDEGGSFGLRDEGLLESALARPRNRWEYEPGSSVFALAAAYAYGVIKNHPFVDGNKRVGLACAGVFLLLNGHELDAPEPEAVLVIRDMASGELGEKELVAWLKDRSVPYAR